MSAQEKSNVNLDSGVSCTTGELMIPHLGCCFPCITHLLQIQTVTDTKKVNQRMILEMESCSCERRLGRLRGQDLKQLELIPESMELISRNAENLNIRIEDSEYMRPNMYNLVLNTPGLKKDVYKH